MCVAIPIFPNPEQFLKEKEGKKERPFTNTLALTVKSVHSPLMHKNIRES